MEVTLSPGQETTIGSYKLVYTGLTSSQEGQKDVMSAAVTAYEGDQLIGKMTPSKEFYKGFDNPNTEVSIRSTPVEDLYLILNSWNDQAASFKFVINPLISWIWAGGYLLLLGAVVAFWPDARERRREAARIAVERPVTEALQTAEV
jgi:cytochrome c-type biogenesis protein CcmF